MERWSTLTSSLGSLNIGSNAGKIAKGFSSSVQATRERLGQVAVEDITELPQEYRDLEARVDALRTAHNNLLKVTSVYATAYDYPTQIQESLSDMTTSLTTNLASLTATTFKGTNLPVPNVPSQVPSQPKTFPHAIARASASAAHALGPNDRLGKALNEYTNAYTRIGEARLVQDDTILENFVAPWQATLTNSIQIAMKARQSVKTSRLELDAAKQTLKSAAPARQEQARLDVENAEDELVAKTEQAISLMKAVLENPEPLKNLNELAKAQLIFHSQATEALSAVQGELEELSVAAEGDYRKSRDM
ncbi:hypothetical protein FRB96_009518 [Tulasnella sp. 330]|nr:hypothetical protein FRB96_009518 [Tulasnella sp. 330]KAG8874626.1 hypothetical protein FRB97_005767 [Tulasnella sp. 331]KAG8878665.1 hypothetical protein FRB98_006020 [Tulasnella sp. 332]